MNISVHLRGGGNRTDARSIAIAWGLSRKIHEVATRTRSEEPVNADLVIQTGFNRTPALLWAIETRTPYIIMESPTFRDLYVEHMASTFTYNGMQGGGTRPEVGSAPRPHPELLPLHYDGPTLILGQKANDHSLRGSDHTQWTKDMLRAYPGSRLRHHPIMVPKGYNAPIADELKDVGRTIAYTSTASVDSIFAGCETICTHHANEAYGVDDREEWAHKQSWYNWAHHELEDPKVTEWILSGYPEAYAMAKLGQQEIPRLKINRDPTLAAYLQEFPIGRSI